MSTQAGNGASVPSEPVSEEPEGELYSSQQHDANADDGTPHESDFLKEETVDQTEFTNDTESCLKDPQRPRRKKARRACMACQRAHLTCDDERPCPRCVKRGLAESCIDGRRKKAKYLHDAPAEAIWPDIGHSYSPTAPFPQQVDGAQHEQSAMVNDSPLFQNPPSNFPLYSPLDKSVNSFTSDGMRFGSQHSPISPSSVQQHLQNKLNIGTNHVSLPMAHDPACQLNFNLLSPSNPRFNNISERLNFRNTYGGAEMAMLDHMVGAPELLGTEGGMFGNILCPMNNDAGGSHMAGLAAAPRCSLDGLTSNPPCFDRFVVDNLPGPCTNDQHASGNLSHGLPFAVAVASGPQQSSSQVDIGNPTSRNSLFGRPSLSAKLDHNGISGTSLADCNPMNIAWTSTNPFRQIVSSQDRRDPGFIYESIKEPYPYANGFHNLLVRLHQRKLNSSQLTRVAKALAAIRPSLMACTRTLSRQDLIFMEQCFQRTLYEYEDFMHHCPAPTIVCRRTGEVAAVNKEFTALTGWTKEVLLGKELNLNVNMSTGRENLTPTGGGGSLSQPVFVAEFLDEDSLVQVYEDFAELAFENSRGHVTRKGKLIKYRTKEKMDSVDNTISLDGSAKGQRNSLLSCRVSRIDGEHAISRLARDGKVKCTYTWTIKRDVFDIPMMIVMNVSPF